MKNNKGNISPDSWDYKQRGSRYQRAGNYNYGLTGAAAGIPLPILLRAAGYAQIKAGTSKPGWSNPLGSSPYGDDPNDQIEIIRGYNAYGVLIK